MGRPIRTADISQFTTVSVFSGDMTGATDQTAAFRAFIEGLSADGGIGRIPPGTIRISSLLIDCDGGQPFYLTGAGRTATVIVSSTPAANVLTLNGLVGSTIENLGIKPGYTGQAGDYGSGIVLTNAENCTVRHIDIADFKRVGFMAYSDRQDQTQYNSSISHGGLIIDDVTVDGAADYEFGVGPSAFIVADYENSVIRNCLIKNIGLYGYEFKNDARGCHIHDCIAVDTYYPYYFGGDGFGVSAGYVKRSMISNCMAVRAYAPLVMGHATDNVVSGLSVINTGLASQSYVVSIRDESHRNTVRGVSITGRTTYLFSMQTAVTGNYVAFSNVIDGGGALRAGQFGGSDCENNTIIVENRDGVDALWLDSYSIYSNTVVDQKWNRSTRSISASQLMKTRLGDVGTDATYGSAKGFAYAASQADEYIITAQSAYYRYVGSFAKPDVYAITYNFAAGRKTEAYYATTGGTTASYVTDQLGFYPSSDNTKVLGGSSSRWSTVYAGTGTINTSDAREKTQVSNVSSSEKRLATKLKGLIRSYKFIDAVDEKGASARTHYGVLAQDVIAACEDEGFNPFDFAFVCKDEWPDLPAEYHPQTGEEIVPARPAGDRYGIRYSELLMFILSATA